MALASRFVQASPLPVTLRCSSRRQPFVLEGCCPEGEEAGLVEWGWRRVRSLLGQLVVAFPVVMLLNGPCPRMGGEVPSGLVDQLFSELEGQQA